MERGGDEPLLNIGTGQDQTIAELAHLVAEVVGFRGELVFDTRKPDGTPRKLLDVSRLAALGWKASIPLREGIVAAYRDFLERHGRDATGLR
jgi:GDP-L-fucose synthase